MRFLWQNLFCGIVFTMLLVAAPTQASTLPPLQETPEFLESVKSGELPAVQDRVPASPSIVPLTAHNLQIGKHGGQMRLLMGRSKDIRLMVVYGYARLVGYDRDLSIQPDILRKIDVVEGRQFTLYLRPGHKWSDGHPFTSEDFRYYWEDIASNEVLSPTGLPSILRINNEDPRFEVLDETTVRYTWSRPNPYFLPSLAGARPFYIYAPAHYMKQFHANYQDAEILAALVEENGQRNWSSLHTKYGRQYRNDNPELPTLQPWMLKTKPPADRFIFVRNPYYHRIDSEGRQLPYVDEVAITIASNKLIPAKTGAGESDLQARNLSFKDYTFLKQGEKQNDFTVRLWHTAKGAHMALYPNLNTKDPEWQRLFRNTDFRRALSMSVNRHEINQVIYFGLAVEGNNTVLPRSPLYDEKYAKAWAEYRPDDARKILDELGLTERDSRGVRLLPDGRPMEIIIETAGEDTEQTDALELIHDSWMDVGIKIYSKPLQREVMRNRIFAGTTLMSIWFGMENGLPTADMSPSDLAPTDQQHLQWPKWGQYYQSNGKAGEPIDMEVPQRLANLNESWVVTEGTEERQTIWHEMLDLFTDNVFTIGLISGVRQPVVVSNKLKNVPAQGIYTWEPGAQFGIYRPDTFWFDDTTETATTDQEGG